jgi:hypothetical protein
VSVTDFTSFACCKGHIAKQHSHPVYLSMSLHYQCGQV